MLPLDIETPYWKNSHGLIVAKSLRLNPTVFFYPSAGETDRDLHVSGTQNVIGHLSAASR